MSTESVLVLNATGKVGRHVCRALREAGFAVHGTTRSQNNNLLAQGVNPVVCNYTQRADLDRALTQTGARKIFVITDFFGAAKKSARLELAQGQTAIDAAKAAGVDHLIFMSVADAEMFDEHVVHLHAKVALEKYLREVEPTGVSFIDWVDSDAYDPKAIRAEFKAGWWGTILTEKLLRRE